MPHSDLHVVPIVLGTLFPVTFIATYIASVLLGHEQPGFPYISDSGAHEPESCFFGQSLNIGAALMVLCVYIRHRQLLAQVPPHRPPQRLLTASLWTGWLASLGVSMVGNFQVNSLVAVHSIGAFLAFGLGIPFLWIQVACTRYDPPHMFSPVVVKTRWCLAAFASVFFVLCLVAAFVSALQSGPGSQPEQLRQGMGQAWFIVSSASEWLMAGCLSAYVVTFAREFRHVSLSAPQVCLHHNTALMHANGATVKF